MEAKAADTLASTSSGCEDRRVCTAPLRNLDRFGAFRFGGRVEDEQACNGMDTRDDRRL